MKLTTVLRLMRFWPPFFGAGIKVYSFNAELTEITVEMKLRFWNKNYVGTHFGGSLYSMTDPFYMLMLLYLLGRDYIVWDKSASIRYKKPAKGTVYATFKLTADKLQLIREEVDLHLKTEQEFTVKVVNQEKEVVAEVTKLVYVAQKHSKLKKPTH